MSLSFAASACSKCVARVNLGLQVLPRRTLGVYRLRTQQTMPCPGGLTCHVVVQKKYPKIIFLLTMYIGIYFALVFIKTRYKAMLTKDSFLRCVFQLFATFTSPIIHFVCPLEICISIVLNFSWDIQSSQRNLKQCLCKSFWGKQSVLRCGNGEYLHNGMKTVARAPHFVLKLFFFTNLSWSEALHRKTLESLQCLKQKTR